MTRSVIPVKVCQVLLLGLMLWEIWRDLIAPWLIALLVIRIVHHER